MQRLLTADSLVVVDALNYIKGYRYELFCLVKAVKTTYCVVQCTTDKDTCGKFNESRPEKERYSDEVLDQLFMRYEPPKAKNRWDSPLFFFDPIHPSPELFSEIVAALFAGKKLSANQSTQNPPVASASFLQDLDRVSLDIVQLFFTAQQSAVPGDTIAVPNSEVKIEFSSKKSMAELARMKRQFMTYVKSRPGLAQDYEKDKNMIYPLFVSFFNRNTS